MDIRINGKTLDVNLDNENTLGDVLSGLEDWIAGSGHRISELVIDEQFVKASMIDEYFSRDIKSIKIIDIKTIAIAELMAASLLNLIEDINEYVCLNFEEKTKFFDKWKETPTAGFIFSDIPDLYAFCVNTFSSGSLAPNTLLTITEEIQREINDPVKELTNIEQIINDICERLVDLPLDIQTGKDLRASQTIQLFSAVTEKLFRIFRQFGIQGYLPLDEINPNYGGKIPEKDKKPLYLLITEFKDVLSDLLEAYEKNDSVLVGDITEYEASVRLKELFSAISNNIKNQSVLTEKLPAQNNNQTAGHT